MEDPKERQRAEEEVAIAIRETGQAPTPSAFLKALKRLRSFRWQLSGRDTMLFVRAAETGLLRILLGSVDEIRARQIFRTFALEELVHHLERFAERWIEGRKPISYSEKVACATDARDFFLFLADHPFVQNATTMPAIRSVVAWVKATLEVGRRSGT